MKLKDKTALLTGAGSGIGRAIALSLAAKGCHLALVDINAEGLEQTAKAAQKPGVQVSTHKLDITDKEAVNALPVAIFESHQTIDLLINNAGISAGGTFLQISEANFDRVMDVNFHALVQLTRAFLPYLLGRPEAHIVNVSSIFGMISLPEKTVYCASKFAVRGFSNALRLELESTNVGVSVVHPGGVATNIIQNTFRPEGISAKEISEREEAQKKLLTLPPEKAGAIIVRGIEKNRARILVGFDAKVITLIERLMPVNYWKVMNLLMKLRQ